jgi:replicative superfamily II helicase
MGLLPVADRRDQKRVTGRRDLFLHPDADRRGKTALSETLLFYHLNRHPEGVAILLVPYRSLAAELRGSLVKRLGRMGLPTRCAYGGTVPTGAEVRDLDDTRAIVATPEALSGLLSAEPGFFARVSLVICDEGHLLDGEAVG